MPQFYKTSINLIPEPNKDILKELQSNTQRTQTQKPFMKF